MEDTTSKPSIATHADLEAGRSLTEAELLAELDQWASSVETTKDWRLEVESEQIQELRSWIAELEMGKAWLESQVTSWRQEAEKRGAYIEELRDWIEQLEVGKAWLEAQAASWQKEAEVRLTEIGRLQEWISHLEAGKSWLGTNVDRSLQTSLGGLKATRAAVSKFIAGLKAGWRR